MPFDPPDSANPNRSIISALVQQADDALAASDRSACIEIIEQIYGMLDVTAAPRPIKFSKPRPGRRHSGRH